MSYNFITIQINKKIHYLNISHCSAFLDYTGYDFQEPFHLSEVVCLRSSVWLDQAQDLSRMSSRMESFLPSAEHSWKTCVLRSQQSRNKIYQCFTSTWPFHCYSLSIFILFQNQHTLTTSFKVPFMGIIIPCSVFYDYYSYKAYILSFILASLAQRLQCK